MSAPLSKGYLLATVPRERLRLRPAQQYRELDVELRLGERVADLGLERRAAELAGVNDYHTVSCARRVIQARAGVTPRQLEDPGFDLRRVLL